MNLKENITKTEIPKQWKLDGNISDDPIAKSLLDRVKNGTLTGSISVPEDYKISKAPQHDVKKTEVLDFIKN